MRGTGTSSGNCCGGFAGGDRPHRGRSDDTTQPRDHPDSARGRASDHCGVRAGLLVGGRRRPVGHVPIPASGALALGTIGLEDRVERLAAGTLKLYDYLLADPLWVDITIIGRTALPCPILTYRLRDQSWFLNPNVLIGKLDQFGRMVRAGPRHGYFSKPRLDNGGLAAVWLLTGSPHMNPSHLSGDSGGRGGSRTHMTHKVAEF